jgi:hypothetical protein
MDVDQQPLEIAERHRLKAKAYRLKRPAFDELPALGFKRVPNFSRSIWLRRRPLSQDMPSCIRRFPRRHPRKMVAAAANLGRDLTP